MIQKIAVGTYLKRYENMMAGERQAFTERAAKWLKNESPVLSRRADASESQLRNVIQLSASWNDRECQAFEEGAKLLTAFFSSTDTWLPDKLYTKSAARSIRNMIRCLLTGIGKDLLEKKQKAAAPVAKKAAGKPSASAPKPVQMKPLDSGTKPAVPRPKHIDQYIHLLPKATQEKAAMIQPLLRDLDAARSNMRLLMDDSASSDADREKWAKAATSIDSKVKSIYGEIDREWAKVASSGRVVVDDLGNARVSEPGAKPAEEPVKPAVQPVPERKLLTPDEKKRVNSLQTWLRDTRRGNGDKRAAYVEQWKSRLRELVAIGGSGVVTASICAAAEHYGINIHETSDKTEKL